MVFDELIDSTCDYPALVDRHLSEFEIFCYGISGYGYQDKVDATELSEMIYPLGELPETIEIPGTDVFIIDSDHLNPMLSQYYGSDESKIAGINFARVGPFTDCYFLIAFSEDGDVIIETIPHAYPVKNEDFHINNLEGMDHIILTGITPSQQHSQRLIEALKYLGINDVHPLFSDISHVTSEMNLSVTCRCLCEVVFVPQKISFDHRNKLFLLARKVNSSGDLLSKPLEYNTVVYEID